MNKDNPDYIAAIERAVKDKYGNQAVQDFRSQWAPAKEKEYLAQLKKRHRKNKSHSRQKEIVVRGDIVIKKREPKAATERKCPVCKTYSFSAADDLYMNRFGCCHDCYLDFVFAKPAEWENGWRPTDQEVEIYLRRRK
jgi:hypothetical protein